MEGKKTVGPGNLALVTGATSGIGYSISNKLASMGINLILVSRNRAELERVSDDFSKKFGIETWTIDCDLSDAGSVENIIDYLDSKRLYPSILVNNAGAGVVGTFGEIPSVNDLRMIHLNALMPTMLTKRIIRRRHRDSGLLVLFVASTIAFRKSPKWAVYAATKSYIISLARSLEMEYRKSNVRISVLCPGRTATNFSIRSGENDGAGENPDKVAEHAVSKLFKGKKVIIPGLSNKIKILLYKILPDFILDRIIARL